MKKLKIITAILMIDSTKVDVNSPVTGTGWAEAEAVGVGLNVDIGVAVGFADGLGLVLFHI